MLGKAIWRSVSEHESIEIERAIRSRGRLDPEYRGDIRTPAAANATVAGAAWWSLACQWQDRRGIFILCLLMLGWQVCSSIYSLLASLIK